MTNYKDTKSTLANKKAKLKAKIKRDRQERAAKMRVATLEEFEE